AREAPEPPETVRPRSNRAANPMTSEWCIELYALSVRFAETRLPVGSGPSRSGRRGNPVVQLSALHWLFRRASGRLAEWFPRDTVPIHPAGKGCQGFIRLFPAENTVSQAEQGRIEKRDSPQRHKEFT